MQSASPISGSIASAVKAMKSSQLAGWPTPGIFHLASCSTCTPSAVKRTSARRKFVPPASMTTQGLPSGISPSSER